jgi:hypothetical protein
MTPSGARPCAQTDGLTQNGLDRPPFSACRARACQPVPVSTSLAARSMAVPEVAQRDARVTPLFVLSRIEDSSLGEY